MAAHHMVHLYFSTVQALGAQSTDAANKLQQADHIDKGDVITITITDTTLPTSPLEVKYKTAANDSLPGIASGIANAINQNPNLQGKYSATASGINVQVVAHSGSISAKVKGTGTERVTLNPGPAGGGTLRMASPKNVVQLCQPQ